MTISPPDKKDKFFCNIDIFVEDNTQTSNILLGRTTLRFKNLKDMTTYFRSKGIEVEK
jgi:hypothetical protein